MTLVEAALLGLVQAVTEFLPVSSSGHLRLAHGMLGWESEHDLLFDLLLHVGTLVAVGLVYGRDLAGFVADAWRGLRSEGSLRARFAASEGLRMLTFVVLATIPTGVIGLLLRPLLSGTSLPVAAVGALLLLNGGWLVLSRVAASHEERPEGPSTGLRVAGLGVGAVLLIGVAQGIAVLPGISRSGATIVAALLLGARREQAARFSFLLSIPAILGAVVLELDPTTLAASSVSLSAGLVGMVVAAAGGWVALRLLLRLLQEARFWHFAFYCWAVGGAAIVWGLTVGASGG